MSGITTSRKIPYPTGTDQVRDGDDAMRALVDRIDYMLGESGTYTTPAVTGTQVFTVDLSRAYPGGFKVYVSAVTQAVAGSISVWGHTELGTGGAGGVGRFTIGANRPTAVATAINWRVVPNP